MRSKVAETRFGQPLLVHTVIIALMLTGIKEMGTARSLVRSLQAALRLPHQDSSFLSRDATEWHFPAVVSTRH